jgi:hypothetical protein
MMELFSAPRGLRPRREDTIREAFLFPGEWSVRRVDADEADGLLLVDIAGMHEGLAQRADVDVAVDIVEPEVFGLTLKQ